MQVWVSGCVLNKKKTKMDDSPLVSVLSVVFEREHRSAISRVTQNPQFDRSPKVTG